MKYLQNTFFNIFFIMIGLIAGAFLVSLTITDKTGLAGGATIFWGGAIGAFLGLVLGVFANIKIKRLLVRNVIAILGAILLIGSILIFKSQENG